MLICLFRFVVSSLKIRECYLVSAIFQANYDNKTLKYKSGMCAEHSPVLPGEFWVGVPAEQVVVTEKWF